MGLALDPTGVSGANLVTAEAYMTEEVYGSTYGEIFPKKGPFYKLGLIVKYTAEGGSNQITLGLNSDYSFKYMLPNIGPDASSLVYGSILLLDDTLDGDIEITYQALGGDWSFDILQIFNYANENYFNPKSQFEALVPSPKAYSASSSVDLSSFAKITASLAASSPIRLGLKFESNALISAAIDNANTPLLPANAAKESGGNLSLIAGNTAQTISAINSLTDAVNASVDQSSTTWFDATVTPVKYYVRRESNSGGASVDTVTWWTPDGLPAAPVIANLQPLVDAKNLSIHTVDWTAITSGTGFAVGDHLINTTAVDTETNPVTIAFSYWYNATQNSILTAAPAPGSYDKPTAISTQTPSARDYITSFSTSNGYSSISFANEGPADILIDASVLKPGSSMAFIAASGSVLSSISVTNNAGSTVKFIGVF